MSYTVVDLIDKIIYIIKKKKDMCCDISGKVGNNTNEYILMNVLIKNLDKSIQYYIHLKEEVSRDDLDKIDFVIYDKISFLINQFNNKTMVIDSINVKNIMESCLSSQKDVLALYIDIQGRLVKNENDVRTSTYKIIGNMISEKKKYIKNLEDFAKKYS